MKNLSNENEFCMQFHFHANQLTDEGHRSDRNVLLFKTF